MERELHPKLQTILVMLPSLYQMLGKRYEVILHDLRYPDSSIVGLVGEITGRKIGGPITNFVLSTIKNYGNNAPDRINYRTLSNNGHELRSTTIFIRDDDGKIIGCLCFNQDLTDYLASISLLKDISDFGIQTHFQDHDEEHFAYDVTNVMKDIVITVLKETEKSNASMNREEKLKIVSKLDEKGIFAIKGSVEYVANCLNISAFSIYGYLKEIRSKNSHPD